MPLNFVGPTVLIAVELVPQVTLNVAVSILLSQVSSTTFFRVNLVESSTFLDKILDTFDVSSEVNT